MTDKVKQVSGVSMVKIRVAMAKRDLSQSRLARAAGTTPQVVSDIFHGRKRPERFVEAILRVLGF